MKFSIENIALLAIMLIVCNCESESKLKDTVFADREEIQKGLKEQLKAEFGEYVEEVTPKDRAYYKAYNKTLTLWNTPFHEHYVPTSLGKAHVIISGPEKAKPLVLLHGMNASSTMWYPNISALSQQYRVYAIDNLLEPGKSQLNGDVKGIEGLIKWYNEIFDQLKLEQYSLIGASKGGWLAVNIALHQGSRIEKLILISPLQTFTWIGPGPDISSSITYAIAPGRKRLRHALETMSENVDNIEQKYIDQYFIGAQKAKNTMLLFQMIPYSEEELKKLSMPVLLLIGDNDIVNKEKTVEKANELLLHVETGIVKNAGHFLSMDQSEIVNARILDFLESPVTAPNQENSIH
jgi:pimeloyl-ACP methyl ester carboxylesterase